jgi:hypothetical protein
MTSRTSQLIRATYDTRGYTQLKLYLARLRFNQFLRQVNHTTSKLGQIRITKLSNVK